MNVLFAVAACALGVTLVRDGINKALEPRPFGRWLRSGGLKSWSDDVVVRLLAIIEVAIGVAVPWPAGRWALVGFLAVVTPIGAVLVQRTGSCACRGAVRKTTWRVLLVRNGVCFMAAGTAALFLSRPVRPVEVAVGASVVILPVAARLVVVRTWTVHPPSTRVNSKQPGAPVAA